MLNAGNSATKNTKNKNSGLWGNSSKQGEALKCLDKTRNNNKVPDVNKASK